MPTDEDFAELKVRVAELERGLQELRAALQPADGVHPRPDPAPFQLPPESPTI